MAVSVGDTNGDGYADVAVGAPGEDVGSTADAGSVTVFFGSASGLKTGGALRFTQATAGIPDNVERSDFFGSSVRIIDDNRNGRAELVIGSDENAYGAVTVLRGTAAGPTAVNAKTVSARTVGLKGNTGFGQVISQ